MEKHVKVDLGPLKGEKAEVRGCCTRGGFGLCRAGEEVGHLEADSLDSLFPLASFPLARRALPGVL